MTPQKAKIRPTEEALLRELETHSFNDVKSKLGIKEVNYGHDFIDFRYMDQMYRLTLKPKK